MCDNVIVIVIISNELILYIISNQIEQKPTHHIKWNIKWNNIDISNNNNINNNYINIILLHFIDFDGKTGQIVIKMRYY